MLDNIKVQFKTKDEAVAALDFLKVEGLRISKASIRKSLPDFKGHVNHNFSLYVWPFSEADYIMICRRIRTGTLGNL